MASRAIEGRVRLQPAGVDVCSTAALRNRLVRLGTAVCVVAAMAAACGGRTRTQGPSTTSSSHGGTSAGQSDGGAGSGSSAGSGGNSSGGTVLVGDPAPVDLGSCAPRKLGCCHPEDELASRCCERTDCSRICCAGGRYELHIPEGPWGDAGTVEICCGGEDRDWERNVGECLRANCETYWGR